MYVFTGADSLITKLTDRITSSSSHKLILAHMPLILVCLEVRETNLQTLSSRVTTLPHVCTFTPFCFQGLGSLAEKFPVLAKQSNDCLKEFLTCPSKMLVRLSRQYHNKHRNLPQVLVTNSDRFEGRPTLQQSQTAKDSLPISAFHVVHSALNTGMAVIETRMTVMKMRKRLMPPGLPLRNCETAPLKTSARVFMPR